MIPLSGDELLKRLRALPVAAPLLASLPADPPVHLVGGAVRDLLIGGAPTELDLVVEGDTADLARRLGGSSTRLHDRFGTSTVVLGGHRYDLATARRERYSRPGALPDVEPAPIGEDLLRRDFTVNAIALALTGADPGALSAAPLALEDLEGGLLRVLHDGSFVDDPTRVLRLARYATRLDFEVEPRTHELAKHAVATSALETVSGDRVDAELRLIAREPDPAAALALLEQLGANLADPEIARRALALLPDDGSPELVVLGLARGAEQARSLASRLQAARAASEIWHAAAGADTERVAIAGALGPAEQAREWLERVRHVRLEIDGDDLLAAGVPQGPAVGRGLEAALVAKLDRRLVGREQELAEALRAAR